MRYTQNNCVTLKLAHRTISEVRHDPKKGLISPQRSSEVCRDPKKELFHIKTSVLNGNFQ